MTVIFYIVLVHIQPDERWRTKKKGEAWRDSLQNLKQLYVPRTYTATSLTKAAHTELCVFSDASNKDIGAVANLKAVQEDGETEVGLVMG